MGESVGMLLELDVTGIAHGGISVARHEGRVVFVTDAIPGERVVARVSEDRKKSFWRADTVSVVTPSPFRRDHVWEAASLARDPEERAGGAEFGHIDLAHQRQLKRQVLVDAFARFAHVDIDALLGVPLTVVAAPGDDAAGGLGWRTRVRLHVDGSGTAGPYASRSHHVVAVDSLPLASAAVAAAAPLGRGAMPGAEVVDVIAPSAPAADGTIAGGRLVIDAQAASVLTEQVGERRFRVDDTGFWQVHGAAPAVLTAAVQTAVEPARLDPQGQHLDLYGGVGLLAAALGDVVGDGFRVTSVESAVAATEHAQENLAEWVGARAETGRVDRWLRRTLDTASRAERGRLAAGTVVLDPPRAGAGRDVVESLAALAPAQIVYVACDPVALARDVATFAALGYRLDAMAAHDLFPHTHHVEAVARLMPAA